MSRAVSFVLVLGAFFLASCAGPARQLHAVSSTEFTLFPGERKAPPPIRCSGATTARFECFQKELESAGDNLEIAGAFSFVTADGKAHSFGRTDELNRTVTEDTRFPLASVTKMFIGAAAVSAHLDGLLDLHAPIARYVPELTRRDGVGSATTHQLLTHTSGLGSPELCETGAEDLPDLLSKYGNQRLLAPPGAVPNYSNLGYSFVALVLERVTGKPFETVVHERVLLPVGIPDASFGPGKVVVRGHLPESIERMPRCRAMWPPGGLVMNVRELTTWVRDLANPDSSKLGKDVVELLTAPHVKVSDRTEGAYGYGVNRHVHDGVTLFSHAGRLEDFSAFAAWAPERGVGVAAVANRSELWVVAAGLRAMSTFLSLSPDWQPPPRPSHPLSAFTGVYVDEAGTLGRLRVSVEDGLLAIDYLDGAPPLLPANFRFVFEPGASHARYVVTPVGVGQRVPAN